MRVALSCLVLALSGCRACGGTTEQAPPDVVEAAAKKELANDPKKLASLCGVSVVELRDVKVNVEKQTGDRYEVHVEGTPVTDAGADDDAGEEDDDDAGPDAAVGIVVEKGKALLCAGTLVLVLEAVHHDDHHVDWKVKAAEVLVASKLKPKYRSHHKHRHH